MTDVFVLQHAYEIDETEEVKLIGVYSVREEAESAVLRLRRKPGFCYRPDDFHISVYSLNKDHWQEGFSTIDAIFVKLVDKDVWHPVHAVVLPNDRYRIVTENDHPEDARWTFTTGQIVRCEVRIIEGHEQLVAVSVAEDQDDEAVRATRVSSATASREES